MTFIHAKDLYFLSVITLIRAVSWVSAPAIRNFVIRGIALTAYRLSRRKRRLTEAGVSDAFKNALTQSQKRHIVRGCFYEFWRETFSLSPSSGEKLALEAVELYGVDHLESALKEGKGVILWESGSFGGRNLAKQVLHANGFALHQVHGEYHLGGFLTNRSSATWTRHHIVHPFFEKRERQFVAEIIYLPDSDSLAFTRGFLEQLKRNTILCITADVPYGHKLVPLEFLGRTKLFATGMVSLAKMSGASLLPMFCVQERDGITRVVIEGPLHMKTGVARERSLRQSVAEYAGLLESYIRRYPEQCRSWNDVPPSGAEVNVQEQTLEQSR